VSRVQQDHHAQSSDGTSRSLLTKPSTQLLLALGAVGVVGGPSLLGAGVDIPDDALYYMIPAWDWLRTAVSSGQSIWFVPGKLGGTSLYVDVVPMGPLYPAWLLALVFPSVTALGIASVLHAVGTLLAVRWLALLHGAGKAAATLAGCSIAAGPLGLTAFQDAQMDTWPAFMWLPMVFACLERLRQANRSERRRWIGLGALSMAMLLLGAHLRLAAASGALIGLWLLVRGEDFRGGLATIALGVVAGLPGFLPMLLEVSLASAGSGEINKFSYPIDQALGLHAIPGLLAPGLMVVGRDVGLGTVLGVALIAGLQDSQRTIRRLAIVIVLLVLAGTHIPGMRYLFAPLVVLSHPVNLVYPALACIPAAALAARGLDRLVAMNREQLRLWLRSPAGLVLAALIVSVVVRVALGNWGFPSGYGWFVYSIGAAQALIVLCALYFLLRRSSPSARLRAIFLLCLLDLCLYTGRGHLAVPSQPLEAPADNIRGDLSLLEGGYLDIKDLSRGYDSTILGEGLGEDEDEAWVQERGDAEPPTEDGEPEEQDEDDTPQTPVSGDSIDTPEVDAPALQQELLGRHWPPHLGVSTGIRGLAGRSKLAPARQVDALGPLAEALQNVEPSRDILGTLFGRAVGEPEKVGEYDDDVTCGFEYCDHVGSRTLALHGIANAVWEDRSHYRLDAVVPRCYSPAASALVEETHERLELLLTRPFKTSGPALLEKPLSTSSSLTAAQVSCPDPLRVNVSSSGTTMVVLRERWHPGWVVRSDGGKPLETFPVNQVHLGVLLDAGNYQLSYRFIPPGLLPGLALGLPAFLLAALLALFRRRQQAGRSASIAVTVAGVALLFAAPASAATVEGTVAGWSADANYEVWLTTSLDLSAPEQPVVRADVAAGTGRFSLEIPDETAPTWLFLHQRIERPGQPPLIFYLPYDLLPMQTVKLPKHVRLLSIAPDLAQLRETGEVVPGSWLQSLYLALAIFLGGGLLLWLLGRWHATAIGAKALLSTSRGVLPDGELLTVSARSPPLANAPAPPAVQRQEQFAMGLILLVATFLRLRGFTSNPLELLEFTYGPGSRPVLTEGSAAPTLLEQLLRPSSLEVTHPPLYHWLLGILGNISDSEWLLRVPSLLASVLTVLLCWRLFRRLSPTAGVLAAAALAGSAPAIHFGRDATPYALIGAIAVGSLLLLLRALREPGDGPWRLWIGLLAFGSLCHYAVVPFALAQITALLVMTLTRRNDPRWLNSLQHALRAGLLLAPIPLLWSLLHFGYFPPVALDTRLFADTYPRDPGLWRFLAEFSAVGAGVSPNAPGTALLLLPLVVVGLVSAYRRDRPLANLLLVMIAAFLGGVTFFHGNLTHFLNGRVFFGFRWITWLLPVVLGLAAVGAVGTSAPGQAQPSLGRRDPSLADSANMAATARLPARLRQFLLWPIGVCWLLMASQFTVALDEHTTHPDYRGAANQILSELHNRDAVATLPLWAQRGPLSWYLQQNSSARFREAGGVLGWHLDGKLSFLEAVNERLPFQSSARNSHFDRLWLAVVNEKMFGREKFSSQVAEDALAWARENLEPDGDWPLENLHLYRFRRTAGQLSYQQGTDFTVTAAERELRSLRWLEPNMSGCIDVEGDDEGESAEGDNDDSALNFLALGDSAWRWLLNVRVPLSPAGMIPTATVQHGEWYPPAIPENGYWQATIEGGACDGPAPVVYLQAPQANQGESPPEAAH